MKATKFLAGAMFCVTAAFLYAADHLAAVIYAPTISQWETQLGKIGQAHKEIGHGLQIVALIFLIVGIGYMKSSTSNTETKQ